ncbi:unnamed protein product [Blepharisma stoltei]|uniref:Rhodanese domain-containing protein n=1 Tax=Blepharisma stoltei TaxID=1481888 RepID=A0AAU9IQH8_9CILI|nr:unnamed protein product [Blepharisma stoltei]
MVSNDNYIESKFNKMIRRFHSTLIKTHELADLMLQRVPIYIIDASYDIPGVSGNSKSEHFKTRLPGAKFFEIDEVSDKTNSLPHMMPTLDTFVDFMKKLRIKNDDNLLVCYDRYGAFTSPRVWYTFKCFGKKNIAVLDGGLPKWVSENLLTESSEYEIYQNPEGEINEDYNYQFDKKKVKNFEAMTSFFALLGSRTSVPQTNTQILDARPPKRFLGIDPEPREGIRSGNARGTKNHCFKYNFKSDGTFKNPEELKKHFIEAGINMDESAHTIHMCGSGISACVNILAMELAGKTNNSLYDGSWTEYATRFPKEEERAPRVKSILQSEYMKHVKERFDLKSNPEDAIKKMEMLTKMLKK